VQLLVNEQHIDSIMHGATIIDYNMFWPYGIIITGGRVSSTCVNHPYIHSPLRDTEFHIAVFVHQSLKERFKPYSTTWCTTYQDGTVKNNFSCCLYTTAWCTRIHSPMMIL